MRPVLRCTNEPRTHGSFASYAELADDREALLAWKAEAMEVLGQWEKVWEAAGCPGPLGGSKAEAVARLFTGREA